MQAYEEILTMVEDVTAQGIREYERDPTQFEFRLPPQSINGENQEQKERRGQEASHEASQEEEPEEESSLNAVRRCHRPWWVCQAYVRPLPKEALEKGSLSLGKKAKRKAEEEEKERERKRKAQEVEGAGIVREERDERDGMPREEIPKEAMVCG